MLLIAILILFSYLVFNLLTETIAVFCNSTKQQIFVVEDILVVGLSSLSLILIAFKSLKVEAILENLYIIIGCFIAIALLVLLFHFYRDRSKISRLLCDKIQKPRQQYYYWFFGIFSFYLIRSFLKAKPLDEIIYLPSRYNTDIFLYLRRISVILGNNSATNHQYDRVAAINILYDSPKLLSSLIYALVTDIFQHPGIAGTVLTSLLLTAIVCKYIFLIQQTKKLPKLFLFGTTTFLLFQPTFSWLQDQFYLSNLLYIYLLIYSLEILLREKVNTFYLRWRFSLSAIAISGFYPSQLPFLIIAFITFIFFRHQTIRRKITNSCWLIAIALIVFFVFSSQYFATTEISQHFNLTDSQHGINFQYLPFWSMLFVTPKPGGLKVNVASTTLVLISIFLGIFVTQYLAKKSPALARYLDLNIVLYVFYSLAFLIFPGSYRQGKFFVTYIIPLTVYCCWQILQKPQIYKQKAIQVVLIILSLYVGYNSITRQYKSHLDRQTETAISQIKTKNQPVTIFYQASEHRYYYYSYKLRDRSLSMISHCPSKQELSAQQDNSVTIISPSCNSVIHG